MKEFHGMITTPSTRFRDLSRIKDVGPVIMPEERLELLLANIFRIGETKIKFDPGTLLPVRD
jgi:hypothetical protein